MKRAILLLALISQVLFTGGATAQTGYEPLADYYVSEFRSFSDELAEHVSQLDKCLAAMDSFEQGNIMLDPTECSKFNRQRARTLAILQDVDSVFKSYKEFVLQAQIKLKHVDAEAIRAHSLMKIYMTKYDQATVQIKQVQKIESEYARTLQEFVDLLKEQNQRIEKSQ